MQGPMKYPKTLSEEVTWSDLIRELGNALEILSFILSSVYKKLATPVEKV